MAIWRFITARLRVLATSHSVPSLTSTQIAAHSLEPEVNAELPDNLPRLTLPEEATLLSLPALPVEPLEDQDILNALDTFAGFPRCFSVIELLDWLGPGAEYAAVHWRLSSDSRFVWIEGTEPGNVYYISETLLFRWFANLLVRMAKAGQARLTDQQLARIMSSLSQDSRWNSVPAGAVAFAESFGLIAHADRENEYVFPIAWMLSRARSTTINATARVLLTWADSEIRHGLTKKSLEEWVSEGLAQFPDREVEILRLREGSLSKERRLTLQQIGDQFGLTRERIRQIEGKFWEKILRARVLRRPFLEGFLAELVNRRGSMLLKRDSPDDRLMQFCAKCVGIPFVEVPRTEFLVLGASSEDFATLETFQPPPGDAGRDLLAQALNAEGRLGLLAADLKTIVDNVRGNKPRRMNRGQKLYLALKSIGRPSHYSKVADVCNSMFPEDEYSEHNVHAALNHEQYGVVFVGIKGTYGLKEWGNERPSKGYFDSVTAIVQQKFSETGKPVPFNVIVGEIGKYRQFVNPTSLVFACHYNPALRRIAKDSFIPAEPGEHAQEEIEAEELDRILKEFENQSHIRQPENSPPGEVAEHIASDSNPMGEAT